MPSSAGSLPRSSPPFPYTTLFRSLGLDSITPERNTEIEGGFDATFGNQFATLGVTLYQKNVTDLLLLQSVAPSTGYRQQIGHVLLRSEEHTSELQSRFDLVCRLLLAPYPVAPRPFPTRRSSDLSGSIQSHPSGTPRSRAGSTRPSATSSPRWASRCIRRT